MSPRIKVIRKVLNPPIIKGFKPYGPDLETKKKDHIILLYEEYEALRLSDYDLLNHHQASQMMNVSRPTFTRIYASALQKIAKAFVEGRQMAIEGGKVYFDSDWYSCINCQCHFNNPEKEKKIELCPLCGSQKIKRYEDESTKENLNNCENVCICPNCGFEQAHKKGTQCNQVVCPKCHSYMKSKGSPSCKNIKKK